VQLIKKTVEGAKVIDLCIEGDKLLEEGTGAVYNKLVKGVKVAKGMCKSKSGLTTPCLTPLKVLRSLHVSQSTTPSHTFHPSRMSRNHPLFFLKKRPKFSIYRSDPEASRILAKDDVVKIQLGAHIDGFASITAETIVIGASAENPVTGRRADVIKAAWTAAEVAMRSRKSWK
jgi:hypothetical protein